MSLLLDALNKADQARKHSDTSPGIDSLHDQYPTTRDNSKRPRTYLLVVAILMSLLAVTYWLGKRSQPTTAIPNSAVTTVAPEKTNVNEIKNKQAINNSATNNNMPTNNNTDLSIKTTVAVTQKNTQKTSTENTPNDVNISTLYQQKKSDIEPITPPTIATSEPITSAPADIKTSAAAPQSIQQFANLPDIHDLPESVTLKIPSLKYTEHHYHSNGGSVMINGNIKHTNDQLAEGLVIDKILEDGLILHFENYSFKMRALNTWVNM